MGSNLSHENGNGNGNGHGNVTTYQGKSSRVMTFNSSSKCRAHLNAAKETNKLVSLKLLCYDSSYLFCSFEACEEVSDDIWLCFHGL